MRLSRSNCRVPVTLIMIAVGGGPALVLAQGFGAQVAPPRFELKADPGEVVHETVEIANAENAIAKFAIRTADWDLAQDGGVVFHPEALQTGSCRPWTRIERRTITVPPNGKKRFRFEVHVPPAAPAGECRFAMLVGAGEEEAQVMAQAGNIRFPVAGQIAVVVYVSIGGAKPVLAFEQVRMDKVQERTIPVALLTNRGNAHGRPEGVLQGTDGSGRSIEFLVAPVPILPGKSRAVPLWPQGTGDQTKPVQFSLPLKLEGSIEWEGGKTDVDVTLN